MSKPASCTRLLRRWLLRRRAVLRANKPGEAALRPYDVPLLAAFQAKAPAPVLLLPAWCESSRANAIRPYEDKARSYWEAAKVKVAREGAALLAAWRAGRQMRPDHLVRYLSPFQAQMHLQ